MPTIDPKAELHTVIVTLDAPAEVLGELKRHAEVGLDRFPGYPGFVGGALHLSDDGTRLVQYLQWRTEEEYLACANDPSWDELPSTGLFMEAWESGRAAVDARAFSVERVSAPL